MKVQITYHINLGKPTWYRQSTSVWDSWKGTCAYAAQGGNMEGVVYFGHDHEQNMRADTSDNYIGTLVGSVRYKVVHESIRVVQP